MPKFQFEATDSAGLDVRAELEAADQLRRQGLHPLRIEPVTEPAAEVAAAGESGGQVGKLDPELRIAVEEFQRLTERELGKGPTPVREPIVCGWCETIVPPESVRTNCPNCGGNLPPAPGPDRGPAPPPPPRRLPAKFIRRIRYHSVEFQFAAFFLAVGLLFAIPTYGATLGVVLVGCGMLVHHWTKAKDRIATLWIGVPAEGEITSLGVDTSTKLKGRHPYKVDYRYQVGRFSYHGSKRGFDFRLSNHYPGEPIWVLYLRKSPHKSDIWPPLA